MLDPSTHRTSFRRFVVVPLAVTSSCQKKIRPFCRGPPSAATTVLCLLLPLFLSDESTSFVRFAGFRPLSSFPSSSSSPSSLGLCFPCARNRPFSPLCECCCRRLPCVFRHSTCVLCFTLRSIPIAPSRCNPASVIARFGGSQTIGVCVEQAAVLRSRTNEQASEQVSETERQRESSHGSHAASECRHLGYGCLLSEELRAPGVLIELSVLCHGCFLGLAPACFVISARRSRG